MGVALFFFTLTGFWLWIGPKVIRNKKENKHLKRLDINT